MEDQLQITVKRKFVNYLGRTLPLELEHHGYVPEIKGNM
jgi:hypothetical protein